MLKIIPVDCFLAIHIRASPSPRPLLWNPAALMNTKLPTLSLVTVTSFSSLLSALSLFSLLPSPYIFPFPLLSLPLPPRHYSRAPRTSAPGPGRAGMGDQLSLQRAWHAAPTPAGGNEGLGETRIGGRWAVGGLWVVGGG